MTAPIDIVIPETDARPVQWVRVTINPNRPLSFGSGMRLDAGKSRAPTFGRRPLSFRVANLSPPRKPTDVTIRGMRVSRGRDGDVVYRFDTQREVRIAALHSQGFDLYKKAHGIEQVARKAAEEGRISDFAVGRGAAMDAYRQSSHLFERVINIDRTHAKAQSASENLRRLQTLMGALVDLKLTSADAPSTAARPEAPSAAAIAETRRYEAPFATFGRSVTQGLETLDTSLLRGIPAAETPASPSSVEEAKRAARAARRAEKRSRLKP